MPTLTIAQVKRLAADTLDRTQSGDETADDELREWCTDNADDLGPLFLVSPERFGELLDARLAGEVARFLLNTAKLGQYRDAERERAAQARALDAGEAAARLADGAIQIIPGRWSLDPGALVDVARAVGRAHVLALVPSQLSDPPANDAPGNAEPVIIPARIILDAARVTSPESWIVDLTADALEITVLGSPRRYKLRAGTSTPRPAAVAVMPFAVAS